MRITFCQIQLGERNTIPCSALVHLRLSQTTELRNMSKIKPVAHSSRISPAFSKTQREQEPPGRMRAEHIPDQTLMESLEMSSRKCTLISVLEDSTVTLNIPPQGLLLKLHMFDLGGHGLAGRREQLWGMLWQMFLGQSQEVSDCTCKLPSL